MKNKQKKHPLGVLNSVSTNTDSNFTTGIQTMQISGNLHTQFFLLKTAPCGALLPRFLATVSTVKTKKHPLGVFFVLVEPTGIEPVSKNLLIQPSPQTVCLLKFPVRHADKQAHRQGSPFLLDRFKGERPMQVHY